MLANFFELGVELRFDFDAHVFGALDHQGLIDQAAQQIFLLRLELLLDFFRGAGFAVVGDFVVKFLRGFLVGGEENGFVVYGGDDFSRGRGGGLGGRLGVGQRRERHRDDGKSEYEEVMAIFHGAK